MSRTITNSDTVTWDLTTPGIASANVVGALLVANALAEIVDTGAARANLGLGSAALLASSALLLKADNLSGLVDAAAARTNLGLGAAATQALSAFLRPSNNLSDLADAAAARGSLQLGTSALVDTGTSGAKVPLLNGANTWSGAQTVSNSTVSSSPTTGALVVGGGAGFGDAVHAAGSIVSHVLPNAAWALDACPVGANITIANGAKYVLAPGAGLISVVCENFAAYGLVYAVYGQTTILASGLGGISNAFGTASKVNVAYNSATSSYAVENQTGAPIVVTIGMVRLRNGS